MITPLPFSPLITILDPPYSSILCHPSVSCVTHPTPLLRLKTSTLNFSKPSFPLSQFICPPVKGCLVPCRFPPSLSYSSHPCGGEVWSMALGFHVAKQAVSTSLCLTPPPPPTPPPTYLCWPSASTLYNPSVMGLNFLGLRICSGSYTSYSFYYTQPWLAFPAPSLVSYFQEGQIIVFQYLLL